MSEAPDKIHVGQPMRWKATLKNDEDELEDTDGTVTFYVITPSGTQTAYVLGTDTEVTRPSSDPTGIYYCTVLASESGRWYCASRTTGSVAAADEHTAYVEPSPVST